MNPARRFRRGPRGFRALLRCAGTPRARRASGPRRLGGWTEDQLRHPDQIVGGHDVLALGMRAVDSEVTALAEASGGPGPAENLLDALADLLTGGVGEREQDMQRLLPVLTRGMWHHALFAQAADELLRVVSLVASDRPQSKAPIVQFGHLVDRDRGLGRAHRGGDIEQDAKTVAVLHGGVSGEAQARLLARTLAHELRLPVGGRLVRLVAALLSLEVRPGVAASGALLLFLRAEALQRGPRFNQRAIDAEVVAGDPAMPASQVHDLGEEQIGHLVSQQASLVLAVRRHVEHLLIERQVHKPAEHQVGLQPRAELPV